MLEIIALIYITRRIGKTVRDKGHPAGRYQLLAIVFWFGGEIVGAFIGALIASATDAALLLYVFAIGGAVLGAVIANSIANGLESLPMPVQPTVVVPEPISLPSDLPPLAPENAALLNDLKNDSAKRRWATIQKLTKQPVNDPRVVAELQRLMIHDPVEYVRKEAIIALDVPTYQAILNVPKARAVTIANTFPSST